ncbi:MAG: hypothetical protein IJH90_08250 [Mogibacterium sp.]|nr:hypothetical protein [Mogibacterium sp.]
MDMGTILRVNLTTGKMTRESADRYEKWIGGIGVAQQILYDEVKPWMSPFDPGNRFIVATGAMTGMLCPGSGRIAAVTKSPMTTGIASGNAGGVFAPKMKYAGFDYIVFEGRSRKPVYLYLRNGEAKLLSADEISGKTVGESVDWFEEKHGRQVSSMCIGPAGENLVRYACVTIDRFRVIGKCGFGAVMGSKNLKAIVADGSEGSVKPADLYGLKKKLDDIYARIDSNANYKHLMDYGTLCHIPGKYLTAGFSFRHGQDLNIPKEMAEAYDPDNIVGTYRVHQSSCGGCFVGCQNHHRMLSGDNAGKVVGGAPFNSVLNFGTKLDVTNYGFCVEATWLCNDLGMDMDAVAEILGWLMECYEKGLITAEQINGMDLPFGEEKNSLELIKMIGYRKGVGDILAEGVARAAASFSRETEYYGIHMKGNDLYEILRPLIGYGFGAAVSTRGGSHVLGSPVCESSKFNEAEREMAFRKFKVKTFNDPLAYDGKAEIVTYYESLTRACSSMGLCIFVSDWQQIHMLDHQDLADLLKYSVGLEITAEELRERMMAELSLEKVFNYCHAGFTREDDMPKERLFKEKVPSGPAKGAVLDYDKWNAMLDHYYEIHGWDTETGTPTPETLHSLGLDNLIPDLMQPAQVPGHAFIHEDLVK